MCTHTFSTTGVKMRLYDVSSPIFFLHLLILELCNSLTISDSEFNFTGKSVKREKEGYKKVNKSIKSNPIRNFGGKVEEDSDKKWMDGWVKGPE